MIYTRFHAAMLLMFGKLKPDLEYKFRSLNGD
jgi:hypothetical protein